MTNTISTLLIVYLLIVLSISNNCPEVFIYLSFITVNRTTNINKSLFAFSSTNVFLQPIM